MIHQVSILQDAKGQCLGKFLFNWANMVIISSNNRPKNLIACVLSITQLAIFSWGSFRDVLSLTEFLRKM